MSNTVVIDMLNETGIGPFIRIMTLICGIVVLGMAIYFYFIAKRWPEVM
jgi:hypothetical protein